MNHKQQHMLIFQALTGHEMNEMLLVGDDAVWYELWCQIDDGINNIRSAQGWKCHTVYVSGL